MKSLERFRVVSPVTAHVFYHYLIRPPPPVGCSGGGALSVCLSVCLSTCHHNLRNYVHVYVSDIRQVLCVLPMAVARSSSGRVAIRYVLPVYG